jgi:hypothetical protein
VRLGGDRVDDPGTVLSGGAGPYLLQVGKRRWARIALE